MNNLASGITQASRLAASSLTIGASLASAGIEGKNSKKFKKITFRYKNFFRIFL